MFNVTAIPESFGEILGLEIEASAIFIALIGLLAIIIFLAVLDANFQVMGIVGIGYLTFCVFMGWFPVWIMILIALFVASGIASKAVKRIQGDE